MVTAYIGIGANLGDARSSVEAAIAALDKLEHTRLDAQSNLFRTAPIDAGGDHYVNAVARIETDPDAASLLSALPEVDTRRGRGRPHRSPPRTRALELRR